jgi:rhodanese-related sulfurtransferase
MSITEIPSAATAAVTIEELDASLRGKEEIALLDVREEGAYGLGHILLAVNVPLSHLELKIARLVPRRDVPTVVYDAGGESDLAGRAARRLVELGYSDVSVLDGGLATWSAAGKETFTGLNVISKAFGEFVQHVYDTPRLQVEELKAKIDQGEDIVIVDSRPLTEFEAISIPGGIDVPGAELIYRTHDLVKSPDTLVVVNCAGRTRAIIGAQALINAEFPNKVVGLENGTSAWLFAGYEPARGETTHAPDPTPEGLAQAKIAAEKIATRFGVEYINAATLQDFRDDSDVNTLYLLDVRTPPEFEAGHLPGSVSAPGGQIVQALDQYVGTQRARIVLVDGSDAVRATATASWLIQLGLDNVFVYGGVTSDQKLKTGAKGKKLLDRPIDVELIDTRALRPLVDAGSVTIVDLAKSRDYATGHIPGAWHAVRSRLVENIEVLPGTGPIVLTSPHGTLAEYAAADLAGHTDREVLVLSGGTEAWHAAGSLLEVGLTNLLDEPDDAYGPPANDLEARKAWFADYVKWGQEVVPKIERDGTIAFRSFAQV